MRTLATICVLLGWRFGAELFAHLFLLGVGLQTAALAIDMWRRRDEIMGKTR